MASRITIQWTTTAKESLKKLPRKVSKGLLDKADQLAQCDDPRKYCKPLTGPLEGYYRITYGRYRAVFTVTEERLATGDVLLHLRVIFVVAGIRKEFDRHDVYNVAKKLVEQVLPALSEDIDDFELREKEAD
ncbi:MAG TPA: type II toxin-antitoxin system RelE/ParE family toxin [Thermoguttaceae bacterium]|nr:type II toxin-antitoxin system RelE/ParE family toxin [Thermoguttaceae bacterium]